LRYSLRTGYKSAAKYKAMMMARRIQKLFRYLRESGKLAELTDEQIQGLVLQYVTKSLQELADKWLEPSDGDRIWIGDDPYGYVEHILEPAQQDWIKNLLNGNYKPVEKSVASLFQENGITEINKDSKEYKKLCRKMLEYAVREIDVEKKRCLERNINRIKYGCRKAMVYPQYLRMFPMNVNLIAHYCLKLSRGTVPKLRTVDT